MTEIFLMTQGHPCWEETLDFARNCSWRAGPHLAEKMQKNDFLPWERVIAARVDGQPAGYCTFAAQDELPEDCGFSPFIGFVFVDEHFRGRRLSALMLQKAELYARKLGYEKVYILSGEIGLYEKFGFEKLGDYKTIYGAVDQLFVKTTEK